MVKRIFSIALAAVLAVLTVAVVAPRSVAADEMPIYRASDAFTSTSAESGPWTWQHRKVSNGAYTTLSSITAGKGRFAGTKLSYKATAEADPDGDAWSFPSGIKQEVAVGKYWMAARMSGTPEQHIDLYAVRTFTAPQTGNITISASDLEGNSVITGINKLPGNGDGSGNGGGSALPLSVRIMLNDKKIWPQDKEWETVPKAAALAFEPIRMNINQGEKLHFEFADLNGSTAYDMAVYWDPVVKYNSLVGIRDFQPSVTDSLPLNQSFTIITENEAEPIGASDVSINGTTEATVRDFSFTDGNTISFAFDGLAYSGTYEVEIRGLKPVGSSGAGESYRFTFTTITLKRYQASEYYDASGKNNPMTVDGEAPWTWESYDLKTESYTSLSAFNSARGYAIAGGWNAVTAVDSSAMYGDTRQGGQGGFVADETYMYAWQRYYPVRTFTVPESGKVTLSAAGGSITAPSSATPNLRILLERSGEFTQIWPQEGWEAVNASAPVHFTPLVQNVVEGDKFHFELNATDAATGNCWSMIANWDPIVAYNEKHPTVTEISPENGAVDVPGNTEFVVSFAEEICEPSLQDAEIDGGAAVAEVWLENENAVHILLDSTTLEERTSYTIKLKNIRLKNLDEPNSFEQCITFTTAGYTVFGEFSRSGATVTLPVNNTLGESAPVTVTVIAVMCQGTPENYTIKSAKYITEVIEGNDNITLTLNAEPENGEFVKAAAVTAPAFGKLLTDMAVLE